MPNARNMKPMQMAATPDKLPPMKPQVLGGPAPPLVGKPVAKPMLPPQGGLTSPQGGLAPPLAGKPVAKPMVPPQQGGGTPPIMALPPGGGVTGKPQVMPMAKDPMGMDPMGVKPGGLPGVSVSPIDNAITEQKAQFAGGGMQLPPKLQAMVKAGMDPQVAFDRAFQNRAGFRDQMMSQLGQAMPGGAGGRLGAVMPGSGAGTVTSGGVMNNPAMQKPMFSGPQGGGGDQMPMAMTGNEPRQGGVMARPPMGGGGGLGPQPGPPIMNMPPQGADPMNGAQGADPMGAAGMPPQQMHQDLLRRMYAQQGQGGAGGY